MEGAEGRTSVVVLTSLGSKKARKAVEWFTYQSCKGLLLPSKYEQVSSARVSSPTVFNLSSHPPSWSPFLDKGHTHPITNS